MSDLKTYVKQLWSTGRSVEEAARETAIAYGLAREWFAEFEAAR